MLYRIWATGRMEWISNVGRDVFDLVDEHGGDLDQLEWQPAERVLDAPTLRLVLRHGRPSRVGLIVAATDLVPLDHVRRVIDAHREAVQFRPEYRKTLARLELIMPGTLEAEDRSNAEIDELMERSIREGVAYFEQALTASLNADAVDHWRRLGGFVPDPPSRSPGVRRLVRALRAT